MSIIGDTIDCGTCRERKPSAHRLWLKNRPSIECESIAGGLGRARGLMGGAFMGTLLAQNSQSLPYDYAVEYLESDGNQYINTGLYPKYGIWATLDVAGTTDTSDHLVQICGNIQTPDKAFSMLLHYHGGTGVTVRYGGWSKTITGIYYNLLQKYTIKSNKSRYDGELFAYNVSASSFSAPPSNEVLLFRTGGSSKVGGLRVYSAQIGDDTASLDLVPVVKDGVPCMYERNGGSFFYNAGTGSFTAGPRV